MNLEELKQAADKGDFVNVEAGELATLIRAYSNLDTIANDRRRAEKIEALPQISSLLDTCSLAEQPSTVLIRVRTEETVESWTELVVPAVEYRRACLHVKNRDVDEGDRAAWSSLREKIKTRLREDGIGSNSDATIHQQVFLVEPEKKVTDISGDIQL